MGGFTVSALSIRVNQPTAVLPEQDEPLTLVAVGEDQFDFEFGPVGRWFADRADGETLSCPPPIPAGWRRRPAAPICDWVDSKEERSGPVKGGQVGRGIAALGRLEEHVDGLLGRGGQSALAAEQEATAAKARTSMAGRSGHSAVVQTS